MATRSDVSGAKLNSKHVSSLSFHVPPDAGPDDTIAILRTLQYNSELEISTFKDLCELAEQEYGAGGRKNDAYRLALITGTITRPKDGVGVRLTARGGQLLRIRPERQFELAHFLLYTGWQPEGDSEGAPLWSYRAVCDVLWEQDGIDVSRSSRQIVDEVISRIDDAFRDGITYSQYDSSRVSFGPKSLSGVVRWLERLWPPAVQDGAFRRRASCSAELLLLTVAWVFVDVIGEVPGDGNLAPIELWLSPERRESISRATLLDPAHLDRLIDWMLSVFPRFIGEGSSAGSVGRFLRLFAFPHFTDDDLIV